MVFGGLGVQYFASDMHNMLCNIFFYVFQIIIVSDKQDNRRQIYFFGYCHEIFVVSEKFVVRLDAFSVHYLALE